MQALPDCLLPVVEAVLLPTYGDLEAVWRSAKLQQALLELPLSSMVALLSSDNLKVSVPHGGRTQRFHSIDHLLHMRCCSAGACNVGGKLKSSLRVSRHCTRLQHVCTL